MVCEQHDLNTLGLNASVKASCSSWKAFQYTGSLNR